MFNEFNVGRIVLRVKLEISKRLLIIKIKLNPAIIIVFLFFIIFSLFFYKVLFWFNTLLLICVLMNRRIPIHFGRRVIL
jgi:hypothetical protein